MMLSKLLSICMRSKLLSINSKMVFISPYPLSPDILFEMVAHLNIIQLTNFLFIWKEAEELHIYSNSFFLDNDIERLNQRDDKALDYFYPDKLRDLRKNRLKVVFYGQYPRIYTFSDRIFGADLPFIFTIRDQLNATFSFFKNGKNSSFAESFKDLEYKVSYRVYDMCLNTDFHSMTQDLNLIPLNVFDGFCALIPKERPIPFYEFIFYPFEKEVWYALSVTIGTGIIAWLISKRVNPNVSVGSFLFKLYGYFLGQGSSESTYLLSQKLILQLFIFAFLILGTCYQSLLVSLIMDPRYSYELKTFEEVKASNLTFAADHLFIENYLIFDREFMPNEIVPFSTFRNQSNSVNTTEMWRLRHGIIFKCSMAEIFMTSSDNYNDDGTTRYYQVAEKIVTTMEAYPSSVFNPYEEKLKLIISSIFESGIKHYWKLQSTFEPYYKFVDNAVVHIEPSKVFITLEDLIGVFVLFLIGNLIALIVFIIEIIIGYYDRLFSNIPLY